MKVLLLGSTGQVGKELLPRLKEANYEVIAPTRAELDLYELSAVKNFLGDCSPNLIINAAAYTAVDKAETEVENAFKLNAHLPETLAAFCQARDIPLIHYSTDYVYDGSGEKPWVESDPVNPLSIYGKSKLAGDNAIINSKCNALIFRTSWVVSVHGHNFVKTMLKLGKGKEALTIVADQYGAPASAQFIAATTMKAIESLQKNEIERGVYHLAPRGYTSWYELAKFVFDEATNNGLELRIKHESISPVTTVEYPTPAKRPNNSRLNCEKLEKTLNTEFQNWQLDIKQIVKQLVKESNEGIEI